MNKFKFIVIAILSVVIFSCEYIMDIDREGETVIKEYELSSFSKVLIEAPVKVLLTQDTIYKVEVEGLDYLLEDMDIIQESSLLTIDHTQPMLITESKLPTVHIYSTGFSSVILNATGKLFTDTIRQNAFSLQRLYDASYNEMELILYTNKLYLGDYYYDNMGTLKLSGSANYANLIVSGYTELNAKNFITKKMSYAHKSAVDCKISVEDTLDLDIYSSGNIDLYGKPSVTIEKIKTNVLQPSGELIYMEE